MKNFVSIAAVFAFLMLVSCQQQVDTEADKKAIIDVINAETQAYMDFDFEKVISYYVQDSLNFRLTIGADDHVFLDGWREVEAFFRDELIDSNPNIPEDTHVSVEKNDYRIKVYENAAYVVCTEKWTYTRPDKLVEIESLQVRFMEKVDGVWKIAFLSFIGTSGYGEEELLEEMGVGFNSVS
ncbi:MAG: nuclear transport factor 2 family protein [Bacteroidales bacterium]|nr:nuclear transport factor 2 family protein [Bacteroidales bacterium]MDT8431795.1 nuclear transport factor 2 family protein [Bacteroidales bacterium]